MVAVEDVRTPMVATAEHLLFGELNGSGQARWQKTSIEVSRTRESIDQLN